MSRSQLLVVGGSQIRIRRMRRVTRFEDQRRQARLAQSQSKTTCRHLPCGKPVNSTLHLSDGRRPGSSPGPSPSPSWTTLDGLRRGKKAVVDVPLA
jgi:hypothetical protein